jgi:hypothetical protein
MKGVVQIPQQQQSTAQRGWGEWREKGKALAARKYHREQIIIPDSEASARYPGLRPAVCSLCIRLLKARASGEKPFSQVRLWGLDSFRRRRHTGAQPSTTPEARQHFLTRLKRFFEFLFRNEKLYTLKSWSWWCKYTVICYSTSLVTILLSILGQCGFISLLY